MSASTTHNEQAGQRYEALIARMRASGCRITPQRAAILRLLTQSADHPSAASIHAELRHRFPNTSLATVYKVLTALKELGEVLELGFADGSTRYDGANPHPHPHLICVQCGSILDPGVEALCPVPSEIAASAGYRLVGHRFDIFGVCPRCVGADPQG